MAWHNTSYTMKEENTTSSWLIIGWFFFFLHWNYFVKRRRKETKKFRKKILKERKQGEKAKFPFPPVPWCSYQCTQKVNASKINSWWRAADSPDPLVPDVWYAAAGPHWSSSLSKFLIYCCKQSSRPARKTYWESEWKTT